MRLPSPVSEFPLRSAVLDAGQLGLNVRTLRFLVERPRLVPHPSPTEYVAPLVAFADRERHFLVSPLLCRRNYVRFRKEMERLKGLRLSELTHRWGRVGGPSRGRVGAGGWRRTWRPRRRGSRRRRWRRWERRGTVRADVAFWGLRTTTATKTEEASWFDLTRSLWLNRNGLVLVLFGCFCEYIIYLFVDLFSVIEVSLREFQKKKRSLLAVGLFCGEHEMN